MPILYPYQQTDAQTMASKPHTYLAYDMGLGKTVTALEAARLRCTQRLAVACPAIVRGVWRDEYSRWGYDQHFDLFVESYDKLTRSPVARKTAASFNADAWVIDEAHYLKNPTAKRTKALIGSAGLCERAWSVDYLSGTPYPNHPAELYTAIAASWPHLLREQNIRSYRGFMHRLCVVINTQYGERPVSVKDAELLRWFLDRMGLIRRRASDPDVNLSLPPIEFVVNYIEPSAEAKRKVKEALSPSLEAALALEVVPDDPAFITLRRVIGAAKAEKAAEEIVAEELEKVVVFAHFRDTLDALESLFIAKGEWQTVYRIDGSTPPHERERQISDFQDPNFSSVMLMQNQTGMTGITLTAAHRVEVIEQPLSPEDLRQMAARCHRIGQEQPVLCRSWALEGTIDRAVVGLLNQKARMIAAGD